MRSLRSIILLFLCVIMLCPVLQAAADAEKTTPPPASWQFGCFADSRWIRKAPNLRGEVLGQFPEWTVIRYQEAPNGFGLVEMAGVTGYVHLGLLIPLNVTNPADESAPTVEGIADKIIDLYAAPTDQSPIRGHVPEGSRLQAKRISDDFATITIQGTDLFLHLDGIREKSFSRMETATPTDLYAPDAVQLRLSPWYGATSTNLPPQTPVQAIGEEENDLIVQWNDQSWYAHPDAFLPMPEAEPVPVLQAAIGKPASMLHFPLKHSPVLGELAAGDSVLIQGICGDYCYGRAGELTGYFPMHSVQRTGEMAEFLAQREKAAKDHQFLDIVLSMVEENNPILLKYKETAHLRPEDRLNRAQPYPLGIPYLFGGMNIRNVGHIMYGVANSLYYSTGERYFGGLDCIGFARTVHRQWGMPRVPRISSIPSYSDHLIDLSAIPLEKWQEHLEVGDCFAMRKRKSYHIALYLGTLRAFGFTEQEVGSDLAHLTDFPLVIHVGMNNFATGWYADYIQAKGIRNVTPPDGGITISILAPNDQAVHTETMWAGTPNEMSFYWTELQGYPLNFMDLTSSSMKWWVVYRNDPGNPPPRKVTPATTTDLSEAAFPAAAPVNP